MKPGLFSKAAIAASLAMSTSLIPAYSASAQDTQATTELRQRSEDLQRDIAQVADNVWTAVGYSPANISMIVGDDGLIFIDTGMTPANAATALAEFRKISDLPVAAIIYTHGHGDHTGGSAVLADGGDPQIWAHTDFGAEGAAFDSVGLTIQGQRGARQGGFLLPPEQRINNGVALAFYPPREGQDSVFTGNQSLAPTHTFAEPRRSLEIAGVRIELVAAPGETDDGLYVWLPEERVVFSGDNFYASWPNAYAIRGTPYRDVRAWADTNDAMASEGALALVPGHTRPILGEADVGQALTDYRDAIRFVLNKTIEGMNAGLTPDDLVDYVVLPPELARKDYLKEFYGNIDWAVRAIYQGYLGWFDGNPANLFPLSPSEEARRVAMLAGGAEALMAHARYALAQGNAQWAAQLADHILALAPENGAAMELKASALTLLADDLLTATGRNYYLTSAQELRRRAAALRESL